MSYFLIVSRLFCHPCKRKKEAILTKNGLLGGHGKDSHGTWKYWAASGPFFLMIPHMNNHIRIALDENFLLIERYQLIALKKNKLRFLQVSLKALYG